ncbi:hypothetical protein [Piscirickettsia litoralis]|uniref:Uncharacterized protein n=1 Tax=Piscirickettsia litoralis TaxID=1891921 RepID=A0ABX2ZZ36_9GAMM|nr:hypothetical protein [Piscirickettsia litoralis]ODN41493.1 hypothetical protein BGC07_15375 [Piscirickettsia litoralis]
MTFLLKRLKENLDILNSNKDYIAYERVFNFRENRLKRQYKLKLVEILNGIFCFLVNCADRDNYNESDNAFLLELSKIVDEVLESLKEGLASGEIAVTILEKRLDNMYKRYKELIDSFAKINLNNDEIPAIFMQAKLLFSLKSNIVINKNNKLSSIDLFQKRSENKLFNLDFYYIKYAGINASAVLLLPLCWSFFLFARGLSNCCIDWCMLKHGCCDDTI